MKFLFISSVVKFKIVFDFYSHFCKIQDKDEEFYQNFHVVVCGLDSVPARRYIKIKHPTIFKLILTKCLRWMNGMLMSLLQYNEDNTPDQNTMIPLVDGGTEGLKGNARVIMPGMTACVDCTLGLYPPQVN